MTGTTQSRANIIKHALVFIAAIALVWFAGILPGMILGAQATTITAAPGSAGDILLGLLSAWPIYIGIAICQALTFHYVKRFTTPIFLIGVFALALMLAWRVATVAPV